MTDEKNDNLGSPLDKPGVRVLFITHISKELEEENLSALGTDIKVINFAEITEDILIGFKPHFIVSTILTPSFDIMDVAQQLHELGYQGAYRVLTDSPLPNPGVVLREVRSKCPGIDIDLLSKDILKG